VTGVTETVLTFAGNWVGTGTIGGAGDGEYIAVNTGEYMISECVDTGLTTVTIEQNHYDAGGDNVDLDYRHGATEAACYEAAWQDYAAPFASAGYIQVKLTSTL